MKMLVFSYNASIEDIVTRITRIEQAVIQTTVLPCYRAGCDTDYGTTML